MNIQQEHVFRKPTLLKRCEANPIITPADFTGENGTEADCIFNPGQITFQQKIKNNRKDQDMHRKQFQTTSFLLSHTSYLKCKTKPRFTLIELLIVVAIIAI